MRKREREKERKREREKERKREREKERNEIAHNVVGSCFVYRRTIL